MENILGIVGSVPTSFSKNKDDSLTDRISHSFTVLLLIFFAVIVSAKQFVGDPINCWLPAHFSGNWEEYANSYCWIKNTYYLPFQTYIPKEAENDKRDMITYYQWVPLILLIQAVVFYVPCMVWRTFSSRSGVDINNIVDTCKTFQVLEKSENKNKTLDHLTSQMYRFVNSQRNYKTAMTLSIKNCLSKLCCGICGRQKGNYLVTLYLCVKVLYIGNIAAQFFLMNVFLGTSYHKYGLKFFEMLYYGEDEESMDVPAFPRVTMCDFKIRVLGNVQRYTVQCVLPINLFNEMIYLFMWWWMVLLGIGTIFSFFSWFYKIVVSKDRERFIKKHLMLLNRIKPRDDDEDSVINGDYLTVEFIGCSDLLTKPITKPIQTDANDPKASKDSTKSDDLYDNLKTLIKEKCGKLEFIIPLNPIKDTELLSEILKVSPEDGRREFKVRTSEGHQICDDFLKTLHQDGIFVLRIVGNNTNSITITEVVCKLWDKFCERYYGHLNKTQ